MSLTIVTAQDLRQADVVLMKGQEYCDNTLAKRVENAYAVRELTAPYLRSPTRYVIIGKACSRSVRSQLTGWDALYLEALPATNDYEFLQSISIGNGPLQTRHLEGKMIIWNGRDPLFSGIFNFNISEQFTIYNPPKPFIAAYLVQGAENLSIGQIQRGDYSGIPAILETYDSTYFAFDPAEQAQNGVVRNLFFNALIPPQTTP